MNSELEIIYTFCATDSCLLPKHIFTNNNNNNNNNIIIIIIIIIMIMRMTINYSHVLLAFLIL